MKNQNEKPDAVTPVASDALLCFVESKLAAARKSLKAREESAAAWASGGSKVWRAVGCRMTKPQRIRAAQREGRIAEKLKTEVEMLEAIAEFISKHNTD